MARHLYAVQGQTPMFDEEWVTVYETTDPVEAVHGAHELEGWFWRRVLEDGVVCVDKF